PCLPPAGRQHRGPGRARPPDHHRPGTGHQSLPAGAGRRPGRRHRGGAATRNVKSTPVSTFSAPRGTYDLIPPDSATVLAVREALAAPLRRAGYGYVETPGFEHVELFSRGVGESTDIVTKEMYTLTTKGGDQLALR